MNELCVEVTHLFWESARSGMVILSSDWDKRKGEPPLYFGPDKTALLSLEQLQANEAGRYFRYFLKNDKWVFRIQSHRYPQLASGDKTIYLTGDFNEWDAAIGNKTWELKPLGSEKSLYEISIMRDKLPSNGPAQFKFITEDGDWLDVPDSAPNRAETPLGAGNFCFNPEQSGSHIFRFCLHDDYRTNGQEYIGWKSPEGFSQRGLPHTQSLLSLDTQHPLGVRVDAEERTTFSLFAPRADAVRVFYGRTLDTANHSALDLEKIDSAVWSVTVDEDLDGYFYSYRIEGSRIEGTAHFDGMFPILDPYAKACVSHCGPGVIISDNRLKRTEPAFEAPPWHDLILLEAHVRDLVAHAPIDLSEKERKGFAGLRKWLQAEGSYLRELGINAVELQPIQEFDNRHPDDYHWGYMTVNYFSPESSYASDPARASQIEEFRGMVKDFHDNGIAVILDVVYNHVGEPNHLLFIDKYYYFHLDEANDLVNWSGCGNDLRCDTPMGKRLIIDSLKHLIEVYDVDGFRFDLAELIGIEVLREIEMELKQIKPSVVLIAEPWSFRGHIQDELRETGYASWNDGFRESVPQYLKGEGNQEMIRYYLSGSPGNTRFAAQSINYTESHDDFCWIDRITESPDHNGNTPTWLDQRRTYLMSGILFASLGVPMISAGQDFMRSKQGVENTYQRGDLNALDYNKRYQWSGLHSYCRAWITFRLSERGAALRYDGHPPKTYLEANFTDGSSAVVMLFNADYSSPAPRLIFGVNPHFEYANIDCPSICQGHWLQLADAERFEVNGLEHAKYPVNESTISLPPLSCGLWIELS